MTLLVTVLLAALAVTAQAQQFPARPVRLIVPFGAGGGIDTVARAVSVKLTEQLGQTFVVDNRGGGGGSIGAELVAAAPPDGYTLIMMAAASVIHPLMVKARFDALRDFAPVSQVTTQPYVIVVNLKLPIQNVNELVAYAKADPEKLNYGSPGPGTLIHLATELFKSVTGTRMVHVPYKGTAAAYPDLVAGNIQVIFASIISAQPHIKAQRIRALAVTGAKRAQSSPELPTVAEAGVPGYVVTQWYAVFAPAGTPRAIVDRLHDAIVKALKLPDVAARLAADGAESVGSTPQQLAAHVRAERDRWSKVIKDAGIRGD